MRMTTTNCFFALMASAGFTLPHELPYAATASALLGNGRDQCVEPTKT